jgi:hypothetical protein
MLKLYIIAVLEKVSDGTIDGTDVIGAIISIARMAEKHMGGTSGALYSSVFPTTCIFSNQSSIRVLLPTESSLRHWHKAYIMRVTAGTLQ